MKEKDFLNNLNVPGLKIILSSKRNIWIRVIWTLAIVFCIGLFCNQISERINFFINHSTGTKIVESDETVPVLPKISICNSLSTLYSRMGYSMPSIPNLPTWLCKIKNQSIDDSFKKLRPSVDNIEFIGQDNRNKRKKVPFAYKRWNSLIGACITLSPEVDNPVKSLHLSIKDSWYTLSATENNTQYTLYIHEESIPFTPEWIIKQSMLDSEVSLIATIDSSKFAYFNTTEKPCVSRVRYEWCRRKCLERSYNLTYCELPYMKSIHEDVKPRCQNEQQCELSIKQAHKIYLELNPGKCNCEPKCEQFLYNVQLNLALTNRYEGNTIPTAHLELQFKTFTLIEEYVTYNFVSLLSDIGGCLGLTLGLSILGMVETIDGLIKWVKNIKIKRMRSKSISKRHRQVFVKKGTHSGSHRWYHSIHFLLKRCRFSKCVKSGQKSKSRLPNDDDLPEISIPGMPNVYAQSNLLRKIFWLVAIIVCLILSVTQIFRHVQYLHNNSTAIRISVNLNEDIDLPIITFCPVIPGPILKYNTHFRSKKYFEKCAELGYNDTSHICEFLRIPKMDVSTLWQDNTADLIILALNNLHVDYPLITSRWGFNKIGGSCIAYQPVVKFPQNHFFYDLAIGIYHTVWQVPLNEELINMYLSDSLDFSDFEIFQHAQPLKINAETHITVQIIKFSNLNRPQSPCYAKSTVNHYRYDCLSKIMKKNASCELPGLGLGLPLCNGTESCRRYHDHFISTIRKFNWDKCKAQYRTCNGTVYKFSFYSVPIPATYKDITAIKFYFRDLAVKYVEEYVTYTFISLLCDAGAIFGVMMGACILTVLQLIELAVHGFKSVFKSKKTEPKTNIIFVKRR